MEDTRIGQPAILNLPTRAPNPCALSLDAKEIPRRIFPGSRRQKRSFATSKVHFDRSDVREHALEIYRRGTIGRDEFRGACYSKIGGAHMITKLIAVFIGISAVTALAGEPTPANTKKAVFAGGCFWCIQTPYDSAKGVVKTIVGYTGGSAEDATYEKVSSHRTRHREALEVTYDPAQISYEQLLDIFWRNIEPTQADGQFHDIGPQYRTAIFYANDDEKKLAEMSKEALGKSGKFTKPIATEILPAVPFYPAEEYHQKYYMKQPADYEAYHAGSGRDKFFEKTWKSDKK